MVIPPEFEDVETEGEIELGRNCFEFTGYSVHLLAPFRVFDLSDGEREVDVRVEEDLCTEGDPTADMPGSFQTLGTVRVWFEPAVPGHRYRCDFPRGRRIGVLTSD